MTWTFVPAHPECRPGDPLCGAVVEVELCTATRTSGRAGILDARDEVKALRRHGRPEAGRLKSTSEREVGGLPATKISGSA